MCVVSDTTLVEIRYDSHWKLIQTEKRHKGKAIAAMIYWIILIMPCNFTVYTIQLHRAMLSSTVITSTRWLWRYVTSPD